jgi:hypothetical protein
LQISQPYSSPGYLNYALSDKSCSSVVVGTSSRPKPFPVLEGAGHRTTALKSRKSTLPPCINSNSKLYTYHFKINEAATFVRPDQLEAIPMVV